MKTSAANQHLMRKENKRLIAFRPGEVEEQFAQTSNRLLIQQTHNFFPFLLSTLDKKIPFKIFCPNFYYADVE